MRSSSLPKAKRQKGKQRSYRNTFERINACEAFEVRFESKKQSPP